jgi:hypothetical protein
MVNARYAIKNPTQQRKEGDRTAVAAVLLRVTRYCKACGSTRR